MAPGCLSKLSSITTVSRFNIRSTNNGILLQYPSTKWYKTLDDRAFMFAASKLCNTLLLDIGSANSLSALKLK